MGTFRESIEVAVPVRVAYERLCHFEDYPQFMSGVKQVTCLSDTMAHWVMDLGGGNRTEFDTRIIDRRPDELLAWQAVDGPQLTETVTFEQLSDTQTRIVAELDVDAQQLMPTDVHAQETINRRLKADLDGLKQYVEAGLAAQSTPSTTAPHASNRGSHYTGKHQSNAAAIPGAAGRPDRDIPGDEFL